MSSLCTWELKFEFDKNYNQMGRQMVLLALDVAEFFIISKIH